MKAESFKINENTFSNKLIESLPGIYYLYEIDGEEIFLRKWNQNHVILLGYSNEELINKRGSEFFSKTEWNRIKEAIENAVVKGSSMVETFIITRSGIKLPFLLEGYTFINHGKNYLMGVGLEISHWKTLEKTIKEGIIKQKILTDHKNELNRDLSQKKRELVTAVLQIDATGGVIQNGLSEVKKLIEKYVGLELSHELIKVKRILESEENQTYNWEVFKIRFREVHPDFFKKLQSEYPNLTKTEKKFCAYLRLHLSSSQIAQVLNISKEGIRKNRYRIRKKMKLNSTSNLEDHISNF